MERETNEGRPPADLVVSDETQAMFNRQLATYRKITGANCMFHQEVYGLLREVLRAEAPPRFRFLDVACGDASASAAMLQGTAIDHYYGIDLSALSLDLARQTVASLPCAADLYCRDFAEALREWKRPVDVIWIGMSLHHLQQPEKQRLMSDVYSVLRGGAGIFLIWEPVFLEGEDRPAWIDRFSGLRPQWAALTDEEFAEMETHVRLADFPETADVWQDMGRHAGFAHSEELFMMPNRMGRVFKYWN